MLDKELIRVLEGSSKGCCGELCPEFSFDLHGRPVAIGFVDRPQIG